MVKYTLRYIGILIIVLLFFSVSSAQVNPLDFQFVVRDQKGDIVSERDMEARLIIREEDLQDGPVVYSESHEVTTSEEGLVKLKIGQGVSNQDFSDIYWNVEDSYYMKVAIDIPGDSYVYEHTSELVLITPRIFSGSVNELADKQIDSAGLNLKALEMKGNKVYLSNGGVIELPEFLKNVNSLLVRVKKRDVSCYEMEDGAIAISVEGGFPPYSYKWSTGATSQNLNQLEAGTYEVYVSDTKGYTAVKKITIEQPDPMEVSAGVENVSAIGKEDGSIKLQTKGGRPPYSYQWSHGETSNQLSGLSPGRYQVKISSSYSCSIEREYVIKEPIKLGFEKKNVRCYGENSGAVSLNIKGGKPPYKIQWSNNKMGRELDNLKAGRYYVSVVDSWGYKKVDSVNILQPYPLQVKDSVKHISEGEDYGEISLSVKGGIPPYRFKWSNGDTTKGLDQVKNGGYEATVLDDNGCSVTKENIFVYEIMRDDRNGRKYKVITIGDQLWMAENMNIGKQISSGELPIDNDRIEKYCYHNSAENCEKMGALYTWEEAAQYSKPADKKRDPVRGICPDGWHLPSEAEWQQLSEKMGGEMVAGNKLKDLTYWNQPSVKEGRQVKLDVSGFAAIPAGRINSVGESHYKGSSTSFWSASKPNVDKAWHRTITTRGRGFYKAASYTTQKYSVRCIKDE